jgi:hypothetical protein
MIQRSIPPEEQMVDSHLCQQKGEIQRQSNHPVKEKNLTGSRINLLIQQYIIVNTSEMKSNRGTNGP